MNFLDIIFGLFLVLETLNGFKKGFFAEFGSIAGLFLGFCIGAAIRIPFSHFLCESFSMNITLAAIFGFLIPFFAVYFFILISSRFFGLVLNVFSLGVVNRVAGGFFSMLKCALIISIFLNLYEMADKDRSFFGPDHIESSKLYEPLIKVAPSIIPSIRGSQKDQEENKGKKEIDNNDSKINDV